MKPALAYAEASLSVDAAVRIAGNDRAGLERILRYCARPPFALEHLQQRDVGHLVYHCPKPRNDGPGDLVLTPRELIDRIAALVPRTDPSPSLLRGAGACRRPASADFCGEQRRAPPPRCGPLSVGDAEEGFVADSDAFTYEIGD